MTTPTEMVQGREPCVACGGAMGPCCAFSSDEVRRAIRIAAIAADANSTSEISATDVWRELTRGECWVVLELFTEERCYLVLASRRDDVTQSMEGRRLEILQAVLGGLPQNNVAIDLSLAPSTVALNSRLGLEAFGVSGKPSRAHPLLMLAARAASEPSLAWARCSTFAINEHQLRVVSAPRPDTHLKRTLPPAELAVIRRLVEGSTYAQIAEERGTSTRTIANQITAVFRRLRVSGRNELLQRLLVDEGLIRPQSPCTPPPPQPARAPMRSTTETLVPPPHSESAPKRSAWSGTLRSA